MTKKYTIKKQKGKGIINEITRLSIPISLIFGRESIRKTIKKPKNNKKNNTRKRMLRIVGGKQKIWNKMGKVLIPKNFKGGKTKKKINKFLMKPLGKKKALKMMKKYEK